MVATLRPAAGSPRPYHFPAFERGELANGSRLIVCPVRKLPIATMMVVFDSGAARDPASSEGTARMTAKLLAEGTKARSGSALAQTLESIGTSLETGADWDSSIARITFLTEHLDQVIALVTEVLREPTFPERELLRLKSERIAEVLQTESEPGALADEAFEALLYSAGSRFGVESGGSKQSVSAITIENISSFYSHAYQAAAATFIVVGDVSFDAIGDKLSRQLSGWTSAPGRLAVRKNEIASQSKRLRLVNKAEAPQSELRVGHAGLPRVNPDYFPVVVMNAILGGLFGSRINLNLREAHGYTYGASSYFDWRRDVGPFVISTAVATGVTAAALKEINSEVDKIRQAPVTHSELSLAKDYLEGVFPIRYETTASVAAALANLVVQGLEPDYYNTYRAKIQAVTAEHVLDAARQHLKPASMQTLIVGDVSSIAASVGELDLGPVDQLSG